MLDTVRAHTMIEVLCAAHLSSYVASNLKERGGMILVGDPATLKSALLSAIEKNYYNAVSLSDINARALADLRGQLASASIRSLVLPEIAKLFERGNQGTAEHVIGTMRALVAEGFQAAAFEDSRINRTTAYCTVLGAMPPSLQAFRFAQWEAAGFNRRFLWPLLVMQDGEVLEMSRIEQRLLDLDLPQYPPIPGNGYIPNDTTREERVTCRALVKYQPGGSHVTQLELLVRILAVLQWWYPMIGRPRTGAIETVREFARSLGRGGARLEVLMKSGVPVKEPPPHKPAHHTAATKRKIARGVKRARG